ncbi:GNAT family protein [Terasakiella sp. A23]|uniref:GNAT family N-acetyltransferase n=1 Tax=Terasakiella sp. FCG-A23 TaxID=3080561 RepID=UPI002953C57F|nr:GNAT family protein [Terasakiella sp. A23]MDV7339238.1 GNAT family protein [Terasakiella sp. A23]
MADVRFVSLNDIPKEKIISLMNDPLVGEQLPLLQGGFSTADCEAFLTVKQKLWDDHGYGPWAFVIDGEFAGWGGLQEEEGEADFALVLDPRFWGCGLRIFRKVCDQAFEEMKLAAITILLPPSRKNTRAVLRMGFVEDRPLSVAGETFRRFRLEKPNPV